jgi:hypothetical protein
VRDRGVNCGNAAPMNPPTPSSPSKAAALTAAESESVHEATVGAKKIVVAIHGIGDQYRNATIQTVVSAFGRFARYPAAMPLGSFNAGAGAVQAFRLTGPPLPGPPLDAIAFVEVYWADIPRAAQKEGYIIEESKAWARTVVERVRARFENYASDLDGQGPGQKRLRLKLKEKDYFAGADAIEDMIETFAVLDNLLFIAEKAGLLKFDLDYLLTQYIGDVQIVADFANYRANILNKFRQVLDAVYDPTAEIYVVAHSEGTVVAFMAILEAMCGIVRSEKEERVETPPRWVGQLRGFMTFGSPIDKHIVLWPDIWNPLKKPHPALAQIRAAAQGGPIQWRNYYDYGDPVGFKLDTARDWIKAHAWSEFFDFDDDHDHGFGRYLMPGQAHNEYWGDDAVFGHFIQNVMKEKPGGGASFAKPPRDKWLNRLGSNLIPYFLIIGIIYFGVYLIFKGLIAYTTPTHGEGVKVPIPVLIGNVSGVTALLAGMIALARIPRLTRAPKWLIPAFLVFGVGAALYGWLVSAEKHRFHAFYLFDRGHWGNNALFRSVGESVRTNLHLPWITSSGASAAFVIFLAAAVAGFAAWGSRRELSEWTGRIRGSLRLLFVGTRPLIFPGALCMLAVIAFGAIKDKNGEHALWPLVLASAAFIYLWWLATLIFDLVFVWHRYIRFSVAHNYLYALRKVSESADPKKTTNPKKE